MTRGDDGNRAEVRREELLQVAIAAVRAEGPGVSMERIGELAGGSKPTIYRAFGSKLGLYGAIADWFILDLLTDMGGLIGEHLSLHDFIERAVDAIFVRLERDAALYQFLMRRARLELSSTAPGDGEPRPDFLRQLGDAVAAIMADRLRHAGLDPAPAPVWAHAVVGMINTVADWWIDQDDIDRAVVVTTLADILWTGFKPMAVNVVAAGG